MFPGIGGMTRTIAGLYVLTALWSCAELQETPRLILWVLGRVPAFLKVDVLAML
jgi:hypothetical protein